MNQNKNRIVNKNYQIALILTTGLLWAILLSFNESINEARNVIICDYKIKDTVDYKISNVKIEDSILCMDVEYFGTENDQFNLLFSGNYKKSYPPVVNLYLEQIKQDIGENKVYKRNLCFILTNIEYPNTKTTIVYLYYYSNVLKYNHSW